MGSVAMIYIYIPSLIKIGSGIQKLMGEGIHRYTADIQTHREHGDSMSLLWESRLIIIIKIMLLTHMNNNAISTNQNYC
jgi:hypothetical protein